MITAEEFIEQCDDYGKLVYIDLISKIMIEFAKLHVQEALKKASEVAESAAKQYLRVSDDEDFNKELVLRAYQLENIK